MIELDIMDEGPAALEVPLCTLDIDGAHLTWLARLLFELANGQGSNSRSSSLQITPSATRGVRISSFCAPSFW